MGNEEKKAEDETLDGFIDYIWDCWKKPEGQCADCSMQILSRKDKNRSEFQFYSPYIDDKGEVDFKPDDKGSYLYAPYYGIYNKRVKPSILVVLLDAGFTINSDIKKDLSNKSLAPNYESHARFVQSVGGSQNFGTIGAIPIVMRNCEKAGLNLDEVYLTNAIKCIELERLDVYKKYKSKIEKIKQKENLKDSFEQCLYYLFLEIKYIKPSLILSFGERPFQMVCKLFDFDRLQENTVISRMDWLQDYSLYDYWNEKKQVNPHTLLTKKITELHGAVFEFEANKHWIIFMHPSAAQSYNRYVNPRIRDKFETYEKSISGIIQEITQTKTS